MIPGCLDGLDLEPSAVSESWRRFSAFAHRYIWLRLLYQAAMGSLIVAVIWLPLLAFWRI